MVTATKENRITCGLNELRLGLDGYSVGAVRKSLSDVLNAGPNANAFVRGRMVSEDYRLRIGEALAFIRMSGSKGALEPDELARLEPGDQCFHPSAPKEPTPVFHVDRDTFSVIHGKTKCFLGNSKPFQLIERLSRSPGVYISTETLRNDLWREYDVEKTTIQQTVSRLRKKLQAAELTGVVIDGTQANHYCLKIQSVSENSA